ncbi:MAG: hypothetical protein LBQ52_05650 [Helicobacteraceae bacterium]|jgi:hypothetical protein|nr:hypothetical protein [Helicobacteraceae bacterium]
MSTDETTLLIYVLAGCMLLMALFLIAREFSASKQAQRIETALLIAKRARAELEHDLKVTQQNSLDEIKKQSETILIERIKEIKNELRDMQIENDTRALRIDRLEERISEYLSPPSANVNLDPTRAISLYNSGYNINEIARELKTTPDEVILTLKLNNVNPNRI